MTAYMAHADDKTGGPNGGQEAIGSSAVVWVLTTPNALDSGGNGNDHAVHKISVSVEDPGAVLEIVYGRVELDQRYTANGGSFYRGNVRSRGLPTLAKVSLSLHEVLGRYFLSGGHPLQIRFDEPIEALENAESGTDNAFAIWVRRVDSETAVGYHLDVEYEVRY